MSQPAVVSARLPVWAIVAGAGAIVGMAMGLRQVMGLYLQPMTTQLGVGRESFSTAMAVANLVWGIGAVFSGAIADKYGAARVVVGGALCTMAGLYVMYSAQNGADLLASGVLLGLGVSGTGITSLVGAVGRAVPADKRTQAIASLGMAGGIGGFYLASSLGYSKKLTGTYQAGFLIFAALAVIALVGLTVVKQRWRTTWGSAAMTTAKI